MFQNRVALTWLIAPLMLLLASARAGAASSGVRDQAHFFSADAITQAEQIIQQIDGQHQKDLLIETFPQVPADMKGQYEQQGRAAFFEHWGWTQAQRAGVNGVYILICKEPLPLHVQVEVGNKTRQRLFTLADRDRLLKQLLAAFDKKQYDQGLLDAVRFVQQKMDASSASSGTGTVPPGTNFPPYSRPNPRSWGIGGLACIIIAVVLLIVMVRGIFARSGGGYSGGPGGYYPPQGGAYPPGGVYGGGYGGGGGGGFGRGFLGGLLGGALGGYAAQQWTQHPQGGSYTPPSGDSSAGPDTSFSGAGGDVGGSGGGGGADFGGGGGGDFGGGGGGGDFGGGGGDSGGGGGDF